MLRCTLHDYSAESCCRMSEGGAESMRGDVRQAEPQRISSQDCLKAETSTSSPCSYGLLRGSAAGQAGSASAPATAEGTPLCALFQLQGIRLFCPGHVSGQLQGTPRWEGGERPTSATALGRDGSDPRGPCLSVGVRAGGMAEPPSFSAPLSRSGHLWEGRFQQRGALGWMFPL